MPGTVQDILNIFSHVPAKKNTAGENLVLFSH